MSPFLVALTLALACAPRHPVPVAEPLARDDRSETSWTWRVQEPIAADSERVKLVVVGDAGIPDREAEPWGLGGSAAVIAAARARCAGTCDAVVVLGDNLYWNGVRRGQAGEVDREWLSAWVAAWTEPRVDIPPVPRVIWILGNHDWGPIFPTLARARRELDWAETTPGVIGDSHYFTVDLGPVRLVAWDSDDLLRAWPLRRDREACLHHPDATCAMLEATSRCRPGAWNVLAAHHPWVSSGSHGSAGAYDGGLIWDGKGLASAFQAYGPRFDATLAGHVHALELVPATDWRPLGVISGAGAKDPDALKPGALGIAAHGYGIVEASPESLRVTLYSLGSEAPISHELLEKRCPRR